jgi:hypothetical protein
MRVKVLLMAMKKMFRQINYYLYHILIRNFFSLLLKSFSNLFFKTASLLKFKIQVSNHRFQSISGFLSFHLANTFTKTTFIFTQNSKSTITYIMNFRKEIRSQNPISWFTQKPEILFIPIKTFGK